jgi:hypothetical protein
MFTLQWRQWNLAYRHKLDNQKNMFIFLKRSPNTAYSPTLFAVLRRLAGGGGEKVSDWSVERHPPEAAALPGSVVEAKGLQLTAVAIDKVDDRAQRGSGLESQVAAALRGAMCPLTDCQATLPLRVCCGANEG